ncbi:HNH endonuclease, partial [Streptococcus mitis]|uniref:HNH endonuclease n=1 Tax=Streptococcus mitis TaxID=28037 RepID=UPI00115D6ED6
MIDYRFTNFENYNYSDLKQQKDALGKEIDEKAISNIGLHYDKIKPKESKYYEKFEEIYYHKCAYCGVSTAINPAPLYEIDHFFNELQTTFGSDNLSVDIIDNLILSCRNCNQSKKEFAVNDVFSIIHPDSREIKEVFNRGEHFEIKIAPQYCKNGKIQSFYNKMKFHYRFRKLDYLLLNLYFLKEKFPKY